ncbi:3'-5' exonuclease [Pseudoalteromonas luteoviolacea]|uniref:3'-5' exonuclease n=1 Tax=Pseudoalteromonas luteoviolacea TaxID=43657 RepID=UPI001F44685D|nr:3'-5' exonuclease [Pseudoalteromonas luteoviolacea]MCF6440109.1 3'-5' exonuclease [Pseudoalteromonas luteoviolacea]
MKWLLPSFMRKEQEPLWLESELVVVDLELTGLDPNQHEIVSVAWVEINRGQVALQSAQYRLNKGVKDLEQSPIYHGISEPEIEEKGECLEQILTALASGLNTKTLVCHNAFLDWGFLQKHFIQYDISVQPKYIIDTLKLEKKRLLRAQEAVRQEQLTLPACRARYGLPTYQNHNALSDALATAELLLAQVGHLDTQKSIKLRNLV